MELVKSRLRWQLRRIQQSQSSTGVRNLERSSAGPRNWGRSTKASLLAQHQARSCYLQSRKRSEPLDLDVLTVTFMHQPCYLPLNHLEKCLLADLPVNEKHIGHYIAVHTTSSAYFSVGLHTIVEDARGDVELLTIYCLDVAGILSANMCLVLKEPFFEWTMDYVGLRCDHPSDIVIVGTRDLQTLKTDSMDLSEGITSGEPIVVDQTHRDELQTSGPFIDRLTETRIVKQLAPMSVKYSAGSSEQEEHVNAIASLRDEIGKHMDDSEGLSFLGPLEVRTMLGRGRGYVATRQIAPGELLLSETSYAVSYADNFSYLLPAILNARDKIMLLGSQVTLVNEVLRQLQTNQTRVKEFFSLWTGEHCRKVPEIPIVDNMLAVDTFLVQKIISLNSFSFSVQPGADFHQKLQKFPIFRQTQEAPLKSTGIWLKASIFNHSCRANSYRSFVGNTQVVRAVREIAEGEEVTFSYCNPTLPFEQRLEMLRSSWDFECTCERCLSERPDASQAVASTHRSNVVKKQFTRYPESMADLKQDEIVDIQSQLMQEIESIRLPEDHKGSSLDRLLFAWLHTAAAQRHADRVIELGGRLLRLMGCSTDIQGAGVIVDFSQAIWSEDILEIMLQMISAFEYQDEPMAAVGMRQEALRVCQILFAWQDCFETFVSCVKRLFWNTDSAVSATSG